ncbi:MAG: hypothetical protein ACE15D_01830 [Candidatus Eisenbacteria bacterium]
MIDRRDPAAARGQAPTISTSLSRRVRGPLSLALLAASLVAILACAAPARAQVAGAFPHLEPWPAALALGGAEEGLGRGTEATLENPAGMLAVPGKGFAFSHASLFEGGLVHHQAAAISWARSAKRMRWQGSNIVTEAGEVRSAWGLALTNLSGDLPGSDTYGELQVGVAYARRLPLAIDGGIRVRFLQARSTVDGSDGGGYALDLGLSGEIAGFRLGGVARSFFSDTRWDRSLDEPLPAGFDLALERPLAGGVSSRFGATIRENGEPQRVTGGASWDVPGMPLALLGAASLRDTRAENRVEPSAGATFRVGIFAAAYAVRFGPAGLGEIHRFSLRVAVP